jgi:hypothetical protein
VPRLQAATKSLRASWILEIFDDFRFSGGPCDKGGDKGFDKSFDKGFDKSFDKGFDKGCDEG